MDTNANCIPPFCLFKDDTYFYPTICHVCKKFGDGVSLKRCGSCKMISYCNREHQKQHWPQHKPFCKAIQDVLQGRSIEDRGVISEEPYDIMRIMNDVLLKLGHLELYETEMFVYSRKCAVCHERNTLLLKDCQNCFSASFCKDHKDNIEHKDSCDAMRLLFQFKISSWGGFYQNLDYLRHLPDVNTFQNMNDFVNALFSLYEHTSNFQIYPMMPHNIFTIVHSQSFLYPLTLFHAMQILDYTPNNLVIHIIVPNNADETVAMWEILLHLIQSVTSLTIIMLGLKLIHKCHGSELNVCNNCISGKKKVSMRFYSMFYEHYVCSPFFIKPDLILGFDVRIKELVFKPRVPFVQSLAKQNCPLILSGSLMEDLEQEVDGLNTIWDRKIDYIYKGKNPFASLLPDRKFWSEPGVTYRNNYIMICKSLCN